LTICVAAIERSVNTLKRLAQLFAAWVAVERCVLMKVDSLDVLFMVLAVLGFVTMLLPISFCVKAVALAAIIFEVPMLLICGITLVQVSENVEDWKEKVFDLAMLAAVVAWAVFIDILFATNCP